MPSQERTASQFLELGGNRGVRDRNMAKWSDLRLDLVLEVEKRHREGKPYPAGCESRDDDAYYLYQCMKCETYEQLRNSGTGELIPGFPKTPLLIVKLNDDECTRILSDIRQSTGGTLEDKHDRLLDQWVAQPAPGEIRGEIITGSGGIGGHDWYGQ